MKKEYLNYIVLMIEVYFLYNYEHNFALESYVTETFEYNKELLRCLLSYQDGQAGLLVVTMTSFFCVQVCKLSIHIMLCRLFFHNIFYN